MKIPAVLDTKAAAYAAVAIVAALALYWLSRRAAGAVGDAFEDIKVTAGRIVAPINPLSDKNIAYGAVNSVGRTASGDSDWSLGGWFYDLTHDEYDPNSQLSPIQSPQTRKQAVTDNYNVTPAVRTFYPY